MSLPLISIEDYLDLHPEHAELSEHDLMIERINQEHAERQTLETQRGSLLTKKQSMINENNKRKEDIATVERDLEKWMEGARPISKKLDVNL
jgi:THO complex subunit 5